MLLANSTILYTHSASGGRQPGKSLFRKRLEDKVQEECPTRCIDQVGKETNRTPDQLIRNTKDLVKCRGTVMSIDRQLSTLKIGADDYLKRNRKCNTSRRCNAKDQSRAREL